jgi:microcin C transport system permease protein
MKVVRTFFSRVSWAIWSFWIVLSLALWLSTLFYSPTSNFSFTFIETLLRPELSDASLPPLQAPSLIHFCGTDELGRDVLSRLLFGTFYSLSFGIIVGLLTCCLGFFLGLVLTFLPFWVQRGATYFVEIFSSLPLLPLALVGLTFYPGQVAIVGFLKIALGWGNIAQFTRLEAATLFQSPRLSAARSQGLSSARIAWKHLLPPLLPGLAPFFPQIVFSSVLSLATLDFFGLGFPIPTPTLAEMFRQYAENPEAWWLLVFPLLIITGLLLGFQDLERKVN